MCSKGWQGWSPGTRGADLPDRGDTVLPEYFTQIYTLFQIGFSTEKKLGAETIFVKLKTTSVLFQNNKFGGKKK